MKKRLFLISVILWCSCTDSIPVPVESIVEEMKPPESDSFPVEFLGAYISTDYLDELERHGSTKEAQEQTTMSTAYLFLEKGDVMFSNTWSFHEGSGVEKVKMESSQKAIVVGGMNKDTLYSIDFSNPEAIVIEDDENSYRLTQFSKENANNDYVNLVNARILKGAFHLNDNEVNFEPNGQITGVDSIVNYTFNEDYYGAGMQVDLISLRYNNPHREELYGYAITDTSFVIFELDCVEMDEEDGFCIVRELGKPFLRFEKENN